MFYHTNCGHIVYAQEGSMMVSDNGWKDYANQYLGACPVCEDRYPYIKYFDDSVREEVQHLVYKILSFSNVEVYIPTFQNPVDTVRIRNASIKRINKRLDYDIIKSVQRNDNGVVLNLST